MKFTSINSINRAISIIILIAISGLYNSSFSQSLPSDNSNNIEKQISEQQEFSEVPITLLGQGYILLSVGVGDKIGNFVFDTAGGITVISNKLFSSLETKFYKDYSAYRYTGERLDTKLFNIPNLKIGDQIDDNSIAATMSLIDSLGLDGLLSLSFFKDKIFTLDLLNSKLIFETDESYNILRDKGDEIPLFIDNDRGVIDVFTNFSFGNGLRLEGLIDTGSGNFISLHSKYMKKFNLSKDDDRITVINSKSSFGAEEIKYKTTIPLFYLYDQSDIKLDDVEVHFVDDMIYDCVVGTIFFLNKKLTFNMRDKTMIINQ